MCLATPREGPVTRKPSPCGDSKHTGWRLSLSGGQIAMFHEKRNQLKISTRLGWPLNVSGFQGRGYLQGLLMFAQCNKWCKDEEKGDDEDDERRLYVDVWMSLPKGRHSEWFSLWCLHKQLRWTMFSRPVSCSLVLIYFCLPLPVFCL